MGKKGKRGEVELHKSTGEKKRKGGREGGIFPFLPESSGQARNKKGGESGGGPFRITAGKGHGGSPLPQGRGVSSPSKGGPFLCWGEENQERKLLPHFLKKEGEGGKKKLYVQARQKRGRRL